MTLGFLGAVVGAILAVVGGAVRGEATGESLSNALVMAAVYFGWACLLAGAVTMLAGIIMHWAATFRSNGNS